MHKINEAGRYELNFPRVYADKIEIYVDGKLVHKVDSLIDSGSVSAFFEVEEPKEIEMRMLFFAENATPRGAGICEAIRIYKQ